ncbi:MAG: MgtC/SapB family protein [Chitinophagaceae bacterium]
MNSYVLDIKEITIRLLVAVVLGGLIGWERERKEGAAGLRTHMLVCIASSLIMIVSTFGFKDVIGHPGISLDPSRIAAQVISGVGFLGAGTILFLKPQIVKGLTTAAGLWSVAGIGLAVGGGLYAAAIITTVVVLIILALIKPLEQRMFRNNRDHTINLSFNTKRFGLIDLEKLLKKNELSPAEMILQTGKDEERGSLKISFTEKASRESVLAVLDELKKTEGISEISSRI